MKSETKAAKGIAMEVGLPDGVSASVQGQFLMVKGPKGEVKRTFRQHKVAAKVEGKKIVLSTEKASKKHKKLVGSLAAHVKNMIKGSSQNHTYVLKICSGHFPMNVAVAGNKLTIKNFLGEKVPRVLQLKEGVNVKVEGDFIHVTSPSKETAGQVSADIEQLMRRPGYDTRIFQDGIYITNKDGKEMK